MKCVLRCFDALVVAKKIIKTVNTDITVDCSLQSYLFVTISTLNQPEIY